jgi:hypothetical protein
MYYTQKSTGAIHYHEVHWDFPWKRLYVGVNLALRAKFTPTFTTHHGNSQRTITQLVENFSNNVMKKLDSADFIVKLA